MENKQFMNKDDFIKLSNEEKGNLLENYLPKKYNMHHEYICIGFSFDDIYNVISENKPITLVIKKNCYCYDGINEEDTRIYIPYKTGQPITVLMCCKALYGSDWKPCGGHNYVDEFGEPDENGDVIVEFGS